MTTTISPSLGHGALFTQQGVGTTPGYDAIDLRRATTTELQEGVIAAGDYMVTQRSAGGAAMFVDIAAGGTAQAFVQGDSVSGQGLYGVPPHSAAVITEAVTAANASNPRIDSVILEIQDNVHDSSGGNLARVRVVAGTATGGATLSNRTGAPALPSNALLLADLLVPALATTVTNPNIRDRRKWARGAHSVYLRTAGAYTIASATPTEIDATNIRQRIECAGVTVKVSLSGTIKNNTGGLDSIIDLYVDGAILSGGRRLITAPATNYGCDATFVWEFTPAPGSHLISLFWSASGGTSQLEGSATSGLNWTIEEVVRQNTPNNTTTTG